jgi:hypothetical protein
MSDDTTQNTTPEAATEQAAAPSLQISDLVLALQTIQAMAQRGSVKAEEMSVVGGLHDRLFAFLEAQGAITRQTPNVSGEQNA